MHGREGGDTRRPRSVRNRKTTHQIRRKQPEPYWFGADATVALTGYERWFIWLPVSLLDKSTYSPGMSEPYVPDDIREFITKHIATVPQIEALLLIWSCPEKRWSLRQVAARIYTGAADTARALDGLCDGRPAGSQGRIFYFGCVGR